MIIYNLDIQAQYVKHKQCREIDKEQGKKKRESVIHYHTIL